MKKFLSTWGQNLLLLLLMSSTQIALAYETPKSVLRFQTKMAERGNVESQFKLGYMYESGMSVQKNLETALNWYQKAAGQGHTPSQNRITYLEIKRYGIKDKHKEWVKTLKDQARNKQGEALFLLGQLYSEGIGVNKSLTRSLKLLRMAASHDIAGTENEIRRVDSELAKLREQYKLPETAASKKPETASSAKTKAKPVAKSKATPRPKPVYKPVEKINYPPKKPFASQVASQAKNKTSNKNQLNNKPVKQQPVKKAKTTETAQASSKTKATAAPKKQATNSQTSPANKQQASEKYVHPADVVCGGRDRFMSGCR